MPRPSPASTRIVDLMNFLADHPGESFRLSEIARRVEFNKATAHQMLAVLTDAEYLTFDEGTKTFSLGPAVVNLAQMAVDSDSKLAAFALPEMEALAERIGTQVLANATAGDDLVVIAATGTPAGGQASTVGRRGRMVPPLGMIFHAWASHARVDTWLDRISADAQERARFRTMLAVVHQRGFSISADQEAREQLDAAIQQLSGAAVDGEMRNKLGKLITDIARGEHELIEIRPERSYRTRQISAPIFDAQGSVRMGLLVTRLPELPGSKLLEYGEMVVKSAERITRLVAGDDVVPAAA